MRSETDEYRRAMKAIAAVAIATLVTACGTTSFTPAEQANGCEAYVAAKIAYGDRCRNSTEYRSGLPGRKEQVALCGKGVAAAENGVTPNLMNACAAALKDAPCEQAEADVPACRTMHEATGGTELGVLCTFGTQCKTGYCAGATIDDRGVRCGNCVDGIAVGSTCDTKSPAPCVRGASCIPFSATTTNGLCTQYLGQDNACDDARAPCGSGLYCAASTKLCTRQGVVGSACTKADRRACAGALVCIGGKCSVRIPNGGACKSEDDACDALLTCTGGVCAAVPPAKLGELCEGTSCTPDAACKAQICVARKAVGAKCDAGKDVCVASAACVQGICEIPDPGICK